MRQRIAAGMNEWEARVGRTTVYDAFRAGRQMLDADLVAELVRALGASDDEAAQWLSRCRRVSQGAVAPAAPRRPELPQAPEAPDAARSARPALRPRVRATLLLGCLLLNLAGRELVNVTDLPLYLDMVGTAVAAIIVGPWEGAAVGVMTSVLGVIPNGWDSLPFAPVEIVGALLWGYGVRRFKLGRSVPRYLLLNVLVAVACWMVAVPIIVWIDRGVTGSGADQLTREMNRFWHSLWGAVASQNILTSLADKMISGFVALGIAEALPARLATERARTQLKSPWLNALLAGRPRPRPALTRPSGTS
jgi:energy-coupling factor transport system substrate-specific component